MFNGISQTEKNENHIILFYKTSRIGKNLWRQKGKQKLPETEIRKCEDHRISLKVYEKFW